MVRKADHCIGLSGRERKEKLVAKPGKLDSVSGTQVLSIMWNIKP